MRSIALFVFLALAAPAGALPHYAAPKLQARAAPVGPGYALPPSSAFSPSSLAIGPDGKVAFALIAVGGEPAPGLWLGKDGDGKVVYRGDEDLLFTDAVFSPGGSIVFHALSAGGFTVGLFEHRPADGSTRVLLDPKTVGAPTQYLSEAKLLTDGRVAFKHVSPDLARSFCAFTKGKAALRCFAKDAEVDPKCPYSYLFTASIVADGRFAAKVRLGQAGQVDESRPDQIVLWSAQGEPRVIAADRDGDPGSPFTSFDNSVVLNDKGQVAFGAHLTGDRRMIYRFDGDRITPIAKVGQNGITALGTFAMNNHGQVAFTAMGADGRAAILVGDGTATVRVARQGDEVAIDGGSAKLESARGGSPFGFKLAIADGGAVAFFSALARPDGVTAGDGVFVARPAR